MYFRSSFILLCTPPGKCGKFRQHLRAEVQKSEDILQGIKAAITGSVKDNRAPKGKEDRNRGPIKLPKLIANLQNKAKGMGKYMLKKAKQMWRTEHRVASTKALIPNDQTERQGLTFIAGLLSGLTAPASSFVMVALLVVVEMVSMGLQAGLQINQVDPTTTIKPAGLCGTSLIL